MPERKEKYDLKNKKSVEGTGGQLEDKVGNTKPG